jgi:hypothetical protein
MLAVHTQSEQREVSQSEDCDLALQRVTKDHLPRSIERGPIEAVLAGRHDACPTVEGCHGFWPDLDEID